MLLVFPAIRHYAVCTSALNVMPPSDWSELGLSAAGCVKWRELLPPETFIIPDIY